VLSLPLLILAFGFGLVAAAPVGPVNMVAIRRGLVARWQHTLYVALGSVLAEAVFITLAFRGGRGLVETLGVDLTSPAYQRFVGIPASCVTLLIGVIILAKALSKHHRVLSRVEKSAAGNGHITFLRDVATGGVLTGLNPATLAYWLLAAGPTWLNRAHLRPGSLAVWWGVLAATAGLSAWFVIVAMLVRLRPNQVGPRFFRIVNAICGLALIGIGAAIGIHTLLI
jgi:threonine/homoserine/homoserine lactone efflux protein